MAQVRSVDFLPEIFRTDTNKQFLAATLDQLIQEPQYKKTQGYIGRSVGPGVNPSDKYVVEPNKTRADYQLEPAVVSLRPDSNQIQDAITFPGLEDAVGMQGGPVGRPDRLYESDYYSWDPFIDFDPFVNFAQYYWLPNGPEAVDVSATGIPVSDTFTVSRENGAYTFSGYAGNNPTLQLVRGGSYNFLVDQNTKETVNYRVSNQGQSSWVIDSQTNPTLTLIRGNTYVFNLTPRVPLDFWIKTSLALGNQDAYNTGVTRNGASEGLVTFTVPQDAPDTLYYVNSTLTNLRGTITVVNAQSGTGPGFWIQTNPGISGRVPTSPNTSSREVFGVNNNGEDLGLVTFNVPQITAQQFYFDLPVLSQPVDLATTLRFDQINNQPLDQFIAQYDGIDGITYLADRTLVFVSDLNTGGWQRTTLFDPLEAGSANNFETGSFDTTAFDQVTPINPDDRYQVWQIQLVTSNNVEYINLVKFVDIPQLTRWSIRYGDQYANTNWYKDNLGRLKPIPLLTATFDTLYYQDGTDPEIFGEIKLLSATSSSTLFIEDIIGKSNYVSPNGVTFTNGLKVVFRGDVFPASYGSGTSTIECSGTTALFSAITTTSTQDLYVGQQIVFGNPAYGGLVPGISYYVSSIINLFQFTVSAAPGGQPVALTDSFAPFSGTLINYREYYVSGVGSAIELLPVTDFVCPETYVVDGDESTLTIEPGEPDYITIDRASLDHNAWSRSNRWFHVDVLRATADYNNTTADFTNVERARRPIIQFRPDLRLWNMGTQGLAPVDIIVLTPTDALSDINGLTSYSTQGYSFVNGTRVIFQNDIDPEVRNKIYQVEFIIPDTVPPLIAQPIINLTLAPDGDVVVDQSIVCLNGTVTAGLTFWYNGTAWQLAQQKTSIQQAPLFNVYDSNGISFGDTAVYPSSDFEGSKLFSYAIGDTGILDQVLKLPLRYLNLVNIGDIVFDNNLYSDTFVYTRDNVSVEVPVSSGFVREYTSRTAYQRLLGWQRAVTTTKEYQQFKFVSDGTPLELDVRIDDTVSVPAVKIYIEGVFQDPGTFTVTRAANSSTITFVNPPAPGTVLEVLVLSQQTSASAFYEVPINLENNPLNTNSPAFTLGTIRTHYQSLCENLPGLVGPVTGANNTRDLGNLVPYGLTILQQSAPLTLAGYFLRSTEYNIFNSLVYNGREYWKYRNLILDNVTQQTINFETAAEILDTAIENITAGRVETQPFYWSDMIPSGAVYEQTTYTITFTTTDTFDLLEVYDYQSQNYRGFNVYLNDVILVRGRDYVVATDGPRFTVLVPLAVGDTLVVREYPTTYGNFCPNTPTKMGLYPAWRPEIRTETTSTGSQTVIVGHDGSTTPTFGDIRDQVLLEFETRIYNNLKLDDNPVPLLATDVIPGQFRDTGYSQQEVLNILGADFLSYVAWNKLAYRTQEYQANNAFTYNYSTATNKLNGENLLGAWRGIYRYFYDTQQPQDTPWEMLGLTIKPDWWDDTYGSAPYTSGNLNLWDDLAAGIVRDPAGEYVVPAAVRPGLTEVIPTTSQGQLAAPLDAVVSRFNSQQFRRSWEPGDGGPVEASWWNSPLYPFAVMRLLAVTRPAKFFALFADRDLYKYSNEFEQYLYNGRYRLDANGVQVYGDGTAKASYINWIVDYNRQTGLDTTQRLTEDLANLDVRLAYRMASFSDKQYIKLYTDKTSPDSTNTSFLIPDESYQLLLYRNQPFDRASYSSVLIQRVGTGYQVFGYSTLSPFFTVKQSQATGQLRTITVLGATVRVPTFYTGLDERVPYGNIFDNTTAVADFLLSYGRWLEEQGLEFGNFSNGYLLTWDQMVSEFLYWSQQGWDDNAILALNPLANRLSITKEQAVVDTIQYQAMENVLLDQDRRQLPTRNLNIVRIDNTFSVEPLTDQTLSYLDVNYTSFEHMIVLDNRSVFGDLIYDPSTGARQSRLSLTAIESTDWNGSVNAQGFILNQDNVREWEAGRSYTKGEIVRYKDNYWSAATIVQPTQEFNYNDWLQSDYEQIQQGMLPNLATKAQQLTNSYNINAANLEVENDLFSYGLIGFRPREYMTSLRLDDVSQVNVYRQFLDTKGTRQAVELFSQADLGKESADYQIFENWAVQRAVYGANANRSYFELRLNRALLDANPSVIQVVEPQQATLADQAIFVSDIWRESFNITGPDILPTTLSVPTDTALPTAGYVSLDDVDVTVFDLANTDELAASADAISVGSTVWVAKVNDYDWNVYRAQSVPGVLNHVCDNLDGTSLAIFSQPHGLTVGQDIIIKGFDQEVNGVYRVLTVPAVNKITIDYTFVGQAAVINGTGIVLYLTTLRVPQLSDVLDLPGSNLLKFGSRVWVDDDGTGRWAVVEKQEVYQGQIDLQPLLPDEQEGYGTSIAQAAERYATLVGSPNYDRSTEPNAQGAVYVYVKNFASEYQPVSPTEDQDTLLRLNVSGARGFGNSVAFGYQDWAVAGASASLGPNNEPNCGYAAVIYRDFGNYQVGTSPYFLWQFLINPEGVSLPGRFGHAVAISTDERWMYVSAPSINRVYCYGRVDWQDQLVTGLGDGTTTVYNISDTIQIDAATQITVTIDGALQTLGVDYTVSAGFDKVTFATAPAAGDAVRIQRISSVFLDASLGPTYSLNEYFFSIPTVDSLSVYVNSILQRPGIDYDYNADDSSVGQDITFLNVPAPGSNIKVQAKGYWQFVDTLTVPGLAADAQFGYSLATSTDGRQVIVGARDATVDGELYAGQVYVFDRSVERFIYGTDPSSTSFVVSGAVTGPVSVSVNGSFLINQDNATVNAPNSFSVAGNTITVNTDLSVGDNVEIETNQFVLLQTMAQPTVAEFSNLGYSVAICAYDCSVYAGAPQSSEQVFKGGVVERWVNGSRQYGTIISTVANPTVTAGDTIRVNNIEVAVPSAPNDNLAGLAAAINAQVPNATATVTNGRLLLTVTNFAASVPGARLSVLPGSVGTAFDDIGFDTYSHVQTILSPNPLGMSGFGSSISVSETATELVVGTPNGSMYLIAVFDNGITDFDDAATDFFSSVDQSGAVYIYDLLPAAQGSVTNPDQFVFGQQLAINTVESYDQLGTAVNYRSGLLWAGAPGTDLGDSSTSNDGYVYIFQNPSRAPVWTAVNTQKPTVDVRLLNSVFLYDRVTSATTEFLDFFNPLQGKILGAARQNIDYIGAKDPASYNVGPANLNGTTWGSAQVGEMWWDISTVRFLDPNQDSITYASRRWGQTFPGSTVSVYQWTVSDVPPALYTGPGVPRDTLSYVTNSLLNNQGIIVTEYFFWVQNITTVATAKGKTLSAQSVARYIDNPLSTGIAYLAPINASTVAIYNCGDLIVAQDTILHIEYDKQYTNDNVHVEYELIAQGRADDFLSDNLYRKLQDSLCGVDTAGNLVPDTNLSPADRYGVQFRPRQSMFSDRFQALKNYITRANEVLARFPISETRSFNLLNSAEPEPTASTGVWNMRVASLEILSFQNLSLVPIGYRYLVESDSSQRGLWTIYTVVASSTPGGRELLLSQVQNYRTNDYWTYIDWYRPGYNSSLRPVLEVPNVASLDTLSIPVGSSVKVTANGQNKFEIYLSTELGFERVGLQDGTIEISAELYDYALGRFGFDVEVFDAQYFDQEPVIETRKIIQAINQELFVDDLLIERNNLLVLMFNFVLTEFEAPQWLVKTSLIDVDHRIRELLPFPNYVRDNQEFVIDYIQEVKPYHVQVREFNLQYFGSDVYTGDITDFDVPAYYNTALTIPQFTSPILLPYAHSAYQAANTKSDAAATAQIWNQWPWSQWYENYLYDLDSITIISAGSGYTEAPVVTITGDAEVPATAVALISNGSIIAINITDLGSGYRSTPTISFQGGNGSGARAYARLANSLVRELRTTIKYDRYQYQPSVTAWNPDTIYVNGSLVRYLDQVWEANSNDSTAVVGPTFDFDNWQLVNPATYQYPGSPQPTGLSGVDRTMGLYVAGVDAPGLDLPLLVDGIDYPGVQVWGEYFLGSNPEPITISCTATDGTFDRITCDNTQYLAPGDAIKFSGTPFGGLAADVVYYVHSVFSATQFTVSTTDDGFPLSLTTASGALVGLLSQPRDVNYQSQFGDLYLGTRATDINVDGGEFIGPYEGHSPPELVNGSEFDTLDIRVYTRPGSDWQYDGHGFDLGTVNAAYDPTVNPAWSWDGLVAYPVSVIVANQTTGLALYEGIDYTLNWATRYITMIPGPRVSSGDLISVTASEVGGGSQLYKVNLLGTDAPSGQFTVPVNNPEILAVGIFVNGELQSFPATQPYIDSVAWNILSTYDRNTVVNSVGVYYRSVQPVPVGVDITNTAYWVSFVPTLESLVTMTVPPAANDALTVIVFGVPTVDAGNFVIGKQYTIQRVGNTDWLSIGAASATVGTSFTATGVGSGTGTASTVYTWSSPYVQYAVVDATVQATGQIALTNSLEGTNVANMIVNRNGLRLTPPADIQWTGDGTSTSFGLPQRLGASFQQSAINPITDILVWVDSVLQTQAFGATPGQYSVTNWTGSNTPGRQVVFAEPPVDGAEILIMVQTLADYTVIGTNLTLNFVPNIGDLFSITTWNDTYQQDLATLVFVGPEVSALVADEPYDSTDFDDGTVSFAPGSYDYSASNALLQNNFYLDRTIVNPERMYVTLDGLRLFEGRDFSVVNDYLVLASGPIALNQTLAVTLFTQSVVPDQSAFHIFQDMRGVQAVYRYTPGTTTALAQPLAVNDDVIYVLDVTALSEPNLEQGVFGVLFVDGERIVYRSRDTVTNTVSGLRRGTAGTGAAAHAAGATVYNGNRGNLLAEQFQNYVVSNTSLGDGSTVTFTAPDITSVDFGDSSLVFEDSLEVYVAGQRQYRVDQPGTSQYPWEVVSTTPVQIQFQTDADPVDPLVPPPSGVEILILQRRGVWWYDLSTAFTRNQALQETDTIPARFLTGR